MESPSDVIALPGTADSFVLPPSAVLRFNSTTRTNHLGP